MGQLAKVVAVALGEGLPSDVNETIEAHAMIRLKRSVISSDTSEDVRLIKYIVADPDRNTGISISWRNILGFSPLNPRSLADALKAGAAANAALLAHAGSLVAFLTAVMALAIRPVGRDEAMVLHIAHRIARADGTFTLLDIETAADELQRDYGVVKVGSADLQSHLESLERAGSLSPTSTGFRLVESIGLVRLS